jgi:hypothetical protein
MSELNLYWVVPSSSPSTKSPQLQTYGAFTLDVKSMLIENLGGIQCEMDDSLMLSEC